MGTRTTAVLVTIAFSLVGVVGDDFLELASGRGQPLRTGVFYVGFALYASTAKLVETSALPTGVVFMRYRRGA